ncbi:MAG: serine/threonine protein kinase [Bifidobacterium tibiigranuli]|jgi:serine/threonine-protein kinase|uniref:serine/threonine protein kinase n=1 Tax=Bifidobacterium tibiigranuli TaxID=2172043 RepID=UPI0023524C09|nr:serine/threonine-protein kinase [Bifidobacterium tibiigranuli]MCH3975181.1 serine/threonine protein kinase [Bifidobacterium tibiigranuli]MCH4203379.1 serine/threonine protein kinase [Bifidobacterium tibiigranuli]MCH4274009.1 serine/threonine protein kinase [Bifidobacterium tibiigranuli]
MLSLDEFKGQFSSFEEHPMARGGQKVVYCAEHPIYGDVVVKLLFHSDARSEREIKILQQSGFTYVPRLFEVDTIDDEGTDTTVLVEQRINGTVLRKAISDGERYDLAHAVDFLEQSLIFIDEISQQGIVHRDIKPENIIRTEGRRYYFLDFGIARVLDATSLTATGQGGPGTAGYCAPEQFTGQKDRLDTRADLFSVGVVAYELVTGVNPFRKNAGNVYEVLYNTATITPIQYRLDGDERSQFMGLLSAMMSRSIIGRPTDARQALSWLNSAKITFGK